MGKKIKKHEEFKNRLFIEFLLVLTLLMYFGLIADASKTHVQRILIALRLTALLTAMMFARLLLYVMKYVDKLEEPK